MSASTSKCSKCKQRKPKLAFTYLHERQNAYNGPTVPSPFCHDCQRVRAANPFQPFTGYAVRDAVLKSMSFASYRDYLNSDLWQRIRLRVLKKDEYKCRVCGKRATQVHHNLYRRRELCGQSMKGMRSLCDGCHHDVEFDGSRKVGLVEASHRCSTNSQHER